MAIVIHPFFLCKSMNRIYTLFLSKRFLQFCSVGASGVVVNLGMFALLDSMGVHRLLASAIAIEGSILSNFAANEFWTFRDRGVRNERINRMFQFQLVSLIGGVIQFAIFAGCFFFAAMLMGEIAGQLTTDGTSPDWLASLKTFILDPPDIGYLMYLAQLVGIGAATGWNFVANLFWTWGESKAVLSD